MSNLVDLCLVPITLQVDQLTNPLASVDMVASADALLESEVE